MYTTIPWCCDLYTQQYHDDVTYTHNNTMMTWPMHTTIPWWRDLCTQQYHDVVTYAHNNTMMTWPMHCPMYTTIPWCCDLYTQQYHDVVTYTHNNTMMLWPMHTTIPWCCDLCTQQYHDDVTYAHNNTMMLWRGWSVWNPVCRALEWPLAPLPWSKSTMTKGAVTLRRKVKGVWVPLDSIRLRVLSDSFRICIKDNTSINCWYNTLELQCAFLYHAK